MSMNSTPSYGLFSIPRDNLLVMEGQYDSVDPRQTCLPIWQLSFALWRISQQADPSSAEDLQRVLIRDDPEGVTAVLGAFSSPGAEAELAQHRRNAMQHLLKAGYDKFESRAITCMWMMAETLSCGDYEHWNSCLDLALDWVRSRLSEPFSLSHLTATESVGLKRGIWSDIVAGATTKRGPFLINLYRTALVSSQQPVLDCPNSVTLAIAETVALAAHPDHVPQAGQNINKLRKELAIPDEDDSPLKARIHTAGARLYLETVAHRGAAETPAIRGAVDAVCDLVSKCDQRRDFAFWIFLAGCHAVDADRWVNCSTMLGELAAGGDAALEAASGEFTPIQSP
jgi:hypothetical protein